MEQSGREAGRRDGREEARHRLSVLLQDEAGFDLVEAALWIAAEEYPGLDVAAETRRVRLIASEAARRVADLDNPFARLDGLRAYLFDELGFRGNLENYDDPANSYLNDVLDRRLGIPITLSILYMAAARAAGFEAVGVGLPGHFVCRVSRDGRQILVDPFHGGRVISEEDCRQLVSRSTGRPSLFRRELLEGIAERSVLGRMLLNLKHIHLSSTDYVRALSIVEQLLLVLPDDPKEIRDRGFLQAHLGRPGAAIADLENYLILAPVAPDAESVRGRLVALRRRLSDVN